MSELQKAVGEAERKAHDMISSERAKMERTVAEAKRQAAEDALSVINQQEDSSEVSTILSSPITSLFSLSCFLFPFISLFSFCQMTAGVAHPLSFSFFYSLFHFVFFVLPLCSSEIKAEDIFIGVGEVGKRGQLLSHIDHLRLCYPSSSLSVFLLRSRPPSVLSPCSRHWVRWFQFKGGGEVGALSAVITVGDPAISSASGKNRTHTESTQANTHTHTVEIGRAHV